MKGRYALRRATSAFGADGKIATVLKRGPRTSALPRRHAARTGAVALGASLLLAGCGTVGTPGVSCQDAEIYRSAQRERSEYLERALARLGSDLRQAEAAMVASDSEQWGAHTRADAVSAVAEARISVQRATNTVHWRPEQVEEARDKLEEAERQLQAQRSGGAVFFASRARRIADGLNEEARRVAGNRAARFIGARQANLRTGPSTQRKPRLAMGAEVAGAPVVTAGPVAGISRRALYPDPSRPDDNPGFPEQPGYRLAQDVQR